MHVVCTRDGGLDLGGGVVLSKGSNDVEDGFWSAWLAKYTGSHLVDDGIVYAVAEAVIEPVSEPEPQPTEEPPHE